MKKKLITAFAICVLFLSACGSLVGTPSNNAPAHPTASSQSACTALEESLTKLNQEYNAARAQLAGAQARKNTHQAEEAEKRIAGLHQGIAWVQAQLKTCQ